MNNQARGFAEQWKEKWFGFWADEAEFTSKPFSLENHVDASWLPDDRDLLIGYLKTAPIVAMLQRQKDKCGLCEEAISNSCYRSDGELLWHDSLAHFVEKHAFVLPDLFVKHIRLANHTPPQSCLIDLDDLPWPNR